VLSGRLPHLAEAGWRRRRISIPVKNREKPHLASAGQRRKLAAALYRRLAAASNGTENSMAAVSSGWRRQRRRHQASCWRNGWRKRQHQYQQRRLCGIIKAVALSASANRESVRQSEISLAVAKNIIWHRSWRCGMASKSGGWHGVKAWHRVAGAAAKQQLGDSGIEGS